MIQPTRKKLCKICRSYFIYVIVGPVWREEQVGTGNEHKTKMYSKNWLVKPNQSKPKPTTTNIYVTQILTSFLQHTTHHPFQLFRFLSLKPKPNSSSS